MGHQECRHQSLKEQKQHDITEFFCQWCWEIGKSDALYL
jgi:hypothetical protein